MALAAVTPEDDVLPVPSYRLHTTRPTATAIQSTTTEPAATAVQTARQQLG
jgi:hypothetical protein